MIHFPYQKSPNGDYFPIVELDVSYREQSLRINTLVDSGASISVFKTEVAEYLKLPIENGKMTFLGGVGGRIKAYIHSLELKIAGKKLAASVVFSYEYNVSFNLLGRQGIFENFKITFDEKKHLVGFENNNQPKPRIAKRWLV